MRPTMRTSSAGKKQGLILILYPLAMIPPSLAYLAAWALESRTGGGGRLTRAE